LVGKNGAGKSTLLKIMTEEIGYDAGEIFKAKNLSIGYLSQHHGLTSDLSVWEELLSVYKDLIEEEKALQSLAKKIEKSSATGNYNEAEMLEYSQRQEAFSEKGGYRYKSDMRGVLTGLGFSEADFERPVNDLSGGQKTR